MSILMQTLKSLLLKCVKDIDEGSCSLSEEELIEAVESLKKYTRKDTPMSKYQAYNYLGISRATFDNYVREGKLPRGQKVVGFTEKMWYQRDLDKFIQECQSRK